MLNCLWMDGHERVEGPQSYKNTIVRLLIMMAGYRLDRREEDKRRYTYSRYLRGPLLSTLLSVPNDGNTERTERGKMD